MDTFKKLIRYIILFILLFLFVGFCKEFIFRENKQEEYMMNYNVKVDSPTIMVKKSRTTKDGGYINGYILNDTGEHIKDKYLQFDFYDSKGNFLGTETKEIKYFNVKEQINFDIPYDYKNVDRIDIDFVDSINIIETKEEKTTSSIMNMSDKISDEAKIIGIPIGIALMAMVILP